MKIFKSRLEDAIYRPIPLVEKICDCVGGQFKYERTKKFFVQEESTNVGPGHGSHRSDGLVDSFIKYGRPLQALHNKFSKGDWKIIGKVLKHGNDHGMLNAFQYKLLR